MKKLVYLIGILAIVGGVGLAVFHYAVPNDTKREVLRELDLEDAPIIKDVSKAAYIDYEVISKRMNLLGDKWVINTLLVNRHETNVVRKVTLRYHFSDGTEDRVYSLDLRPNRQLPSHAKDKIGGHANADFLRVELVSAE